MVSLRDVAKHAGVSVGTASTAFTGNRPISEATRQAVLESAAKLGYVHKRSADRQPTVLNIGYVVPSLDNPFFLKLIEGVEEKLSQYRCNLVLINTNDGDYSKIVGYSKLLPQAGLDGLIVTGSREAWEMLWDACKKINLPAVVLFSPHDVKGADVISSDDTSGAFAAVSYLIERGIKRIAFVKVRNSHIHECRLIGYKQALEKHGIPLDPDLIVECHGHDDLAVDAYAKAFLDKEIPFSGVFCCNDLMAYGFMRALKVRGFRIPQDVSVIGVDDTIGRLLTPSLTTIRIEAKSMGLLAADVLLEKIKDKTREARSILLPERLVIRESTK